jgi:hypothetical protein
LLLVCLQITHDFLSHNGRGLTGGFDSIINATSV